MEMTGEARLRASRERVWESLNDPVALQASITGCEALERMPDGAFTATVIARVGPIKARFDGRITLSDVVAPHRYTLRGEGSGGAAGFAKAEIGVALEPIEAQLTLLRYTVKAQVGGKLAQVGSRMVDAAARKAADEFFAAFALQVESAEPAFAATATSLADLAGTHRERVSVAAPETPAPIVRSRAPDGGQSAKAVTDVLAAELIKVWIADQIAVVTLNRPASRNAMTYAMWLSIPEIFAALARNPDVRVVILTGAGNDFCAGADIPEFAQVRDSVEQATDYEVAVDACCDAIVSISKPTIAVVRGYCLGGGAHLAMSCDFRFSASEAAFGIPAARLSIIYGVRATRKLLSLVGLSTAKKILFGAQRFSATQALQMGFVDHVAAAASAPAPSPWWAPWRRSTPREAGDPMVDARRFARTMSENAPLSMAGAKELLNGMAMGTGALDLERAEALISAAAASHDYREGRVAFAEKRTPVFQGR